MKNIFALLTLVAFSISSNLYGQEEILDYAREGELKDIRLLLNENPEAANYTNDKGFSPLILAAYHGQKKAVKLLLEMGAKVNYAYHQGTALHASVFKGEIEIVKMLLEKGASINFQDENGSTALHYAIIYNKEQISRLLIEKGADFNLADNSSKSAKNYAEEFLRYELLEIMQ